jgi:uncharacterized membrane protein (UPF0127 family)
VRVTGTLIAIFLLLFASACGGENSQRPAAPAEPGTTVESGTVTEPGGTIAEPGVIEEARANAQPELPTVTLAIRTSGGEEVEVRVEVADERAERQTGLMGRTELAQDAGMLFVFGWERNLSFWMRNTLIPLSIAYIAADGRIVDIQDMEPLDDDPPPYASAEPAKYALEVNQGFFAERGVEVGGTVEIPQEYR